MKKTKILAGALALCIALSGCGGGKTSTDTAINLESYPIETDVKLTYWMGLNVNTSFTASNLSETPYAQELLKRTGVEVEYIHPALGQEAENFSLMVASNDLADIVEYSWYGALGGPSTTIADKIIYDLTPMMEKYAPNLSKYLKDNPDVDRMVKTDEGQYYTFPQLRGGDKLLLTSGPIFRKDWLSELGAEVPQTVDEWESLLRRFKEEKGAKAPLTISKGNKSLLFALTNAAYDYYVDNGKMKYGPAEPEFKEALITLNRWFSEGLLDNNYSMTDDNMLDANMLNGNSGVTLAGGGGSMGKWLETKSEDSTYQLVAAPYPVKNENKPNIYIPVGLKYAAWQCASITTDCKYPELAMKYLDYNYGEEGQMLINFGVEGLSYNMVDGKPIYTELITKNPDGLTMSQALGKYTRANTGGPIIQSEGYIEQYYARPQQKEALNIWQSGTEEAKKTTYPTMSHTSDESTELSLINSELQKCRDENTAAFISGIRPMSEFDDFLAELESLKLKRALEIEQIALDRYNNR